VLSTRERHRLLHGRRHAVIAALPLPRLGEPEIEDLDGSIRTDLDIRRFEIAVGDALPVCRLEDLGDLERDGHGCIDGNRATGDRVRKILSVH